MSDIATGEHRGAEVRRSGGTRNVTFLRDWNLARQFASTLYHPGAAPRGENVVKISIRNLNIPTQQGLQEWGKSFESSKTLAVGGYAVGKLDLGS